MSVSTPGHLLSLFDDICSAIRDALDRLEDWNSLGGAGAHATQYRHDVAADEAALAILDRAGVGVLSEESGLRRADAGVVVIIDPVDGSTNANRGIPWFATSLCAVDADGPLVSMVVNQALGVRYHAVRGEGAWRDGERIVARATPTLREAFIGLNGLPPAYLGWRQYRTLGAAALDLCGVADGTFDGYLDCSRDEHGIWDYAGGLLVCTEAGAILTDKDERDLIVLDPSVRRSPVAACTPTLHRELLDARRTFQK